MKYISIILLILVMGFAGYYFYANSLIEKTETQNHTATTSTATKSEISLRPIKGNLEESIYSSPENPYINYLYQTDGKFIYFKNWENADNGDVRLENAEVASFVPIENGRVYHSYGKDSKHVYFQWMEIKGADIATFKPLWGVVPEGCSYGRYSRDKNHVYFKNVIVKDADVESFVSLAAEDGEYGKDKNNVYLQDHAIKNADPLTFEPVCNYG